MKRSRLAALAIAATMLAVTACSSGSDDPPGNPGGGSGNTGQPEEQVTITYTNFVANGGNEDNLDKIVAAFEAENPNIKVKVTTLPYGDYFTALQTDLVAGTQADVFDIEAANFRAYVEAGVAAPINDADLGKYKASLIEAYQHEGTQYALPSSFSTVVMFYNKALFDDAGLDYPTSDWTWEDEERAAQAIANKSGDVWGTYQPVSYNEYFKVVQQAGGKFLSDDGSQVAFDSPEGVKAAEWLVNKVGTVMPGKGDSTTDSDSDLFTTGRLAMWHTGIWMFSSVQDAASFDWDVVVEPGLTQQASHLFSNAVMVSAKSKHQEAAAKWAEFYTSSQVTVDTRLEADWELPPVADESLLAAYFDRGKPENRQAVFDSLDGVATAPSIGDNQAKMGDIVTKYLEEAAAGRLTAQEAVSKAAAEVQPLLPQP